LLLAFACVTDVAAQPMLRLKSRQAQIAAEAAIVEPDVSRSMLAGRSHWLVQFEAQPTIDDLAELRRRGAREVADVPDYALIVSVDGQADFEGMDLVRVEPWSGRDKLSPELFAAPAAETAGLNASGEFIVQFHADTGFADARAVLAAVGADVVGHPQLADRDYLVRMDPRQLDRLAEWDEWPTFFPRPRICQPGHPCKPARAR
jgi:hypothetical protein